MAVVASIPETVPTPSQNTNRVRINRGIKRKSGGTNPTAVKIN